VTYSFPIQNTCSPFEGPSHAFSMSTKQTSISLDYTRKISINCWRGKMRFAPLWPGKNSTGCSSTCIRLFRGTFPQGSWHALFQVIWGRKCPSGLCFCSVSLFVYGDDDPVCQSLKCVCRTWGRLTHEFINSLHQWPILKVGHGPPSFFLIPV